MFSPLPGHVYSIANFDAFDSVLVSFWGLVLMALVASVLVARRAAKMHLSPNLTRVLRLLVAGCIAFLVVHAAVTVVITFVLLVVVAVFDLLVAGLFTFVFFSF